MTDREKRSFCSSWPITGRHAPERAVPYHDEREYQHELAVA